MSLRRVPWLARLLFMSRRDRARLEKMDATQADIVAVANEVRELSSRLDAHAHLIRKDARERHGVAPDGSASDPDQTMMTIQVGDAVSMTAGVASALDRVTEKLEELAVGLRDG